MTTTRLATQECKPCKGEVPPLKGAELKKLHDELDNDWKLIDEHHLEKTFKFDGYQPAVDYTNAVARIAEEQNHHPDILLTWGKVNVSIHTHKIDGLTESDFVFAAKAQEAYDAL